VAVGLLATVGVVVVAGGGVAAVRRALVLDSHHRQRVGQFDRQPVEAGDVVFLGDSLSEFGRWDDWFTDVRVRNRGIAGDDTVAVLARLDEIVEGGPAKVFLMIGTNDLSNGADEGDIVVNVAQIVSRITTGSPDTQVYVQSVLPRGRRYRARVESLNHRLRAAVAGEAVWVDLHRDFVDEDGSIKDALSNDELHLLDEGYVVWRDVISPYVSNAADGASAW
jgi:hexosaminidase